VACELGRGLEPRCVNFQFLERTSSSVICLSRNGVCRTYIGSKTSNFLNFPRISRCDALLRL
jgi:hypothetical protein